MTDPNSLFSNMTITICSKFGTKGFSVDVGGGAAGGNCVGKGVDVGINVTVGAGGRTVGVITGDALIQDTSNASDNISMKTSFIFIFF